MANPVMIPAVTGGATGASWVRNSACEVEAYQVYNSNTGVAFLQLFDAPSGTAPTVGTTVPKWSIQIPTTGSVQSAFTVTGLHFEGGLWIAATTTATGATGPTTALTVNLAIAG